MKIHDVLIQDTFAEAWDLEVVRLVLTAISEDVALGGAQQFVGAAGSSELGARINAGIERAALPVETPDGRPGVIVSCTMPPDRRESLVEELALRVVLATLIPTCSVFDAMAPGVAGTERINIHDQISERWQGHERERDVDGRIVGVVPTTTGEFIYEKSISISASGTDGHIVLFAETEASAVLAIKAAKDAIASVDGVAPMGYGLEQVFRELDYVPALREKIEDSKVPDGVGSILNLLMFGASAALMKVGMRVAIQAAAQVPGVLEVGAMNFGGEFGRHMYHLHELLA
jgi:formylmethanofuran--tetrahydromethanopterin N-formyltransferase